MNRGPRNGFSLIEMVLFIVVVGAALAGMVVVFTQAARHSSDPYLRQRAVAVATAYMNEILQKRWNENSPIGGGCLVTGSGNCSAATWLPHTSYSIGSRVIPTTPNNHLYEAIVAGSSGGSEPSPWPIGGTVNDGSLVWRDLGIRTPTATLGPEGETRANFDDIDDYAGLGPMVPEDQNGVPMPGYDGFTVQVQVTQPDANWEGVDYRDVRLVVVTVTEPNGDSFALRDYRLNF